MTDTLTRLVAFRRMAAPALLALGVIGYLIAWRVDPYVFGFLVLGLGPLQAAVAVLGILARLVRRERNAATVWLVDALLIASAVAAFSALRSISWT